MDFDIKNLMVKLLFLILLFTSYFLIAPMLFNADSMLLVVICVVITAYLPFFVYFILTRNFFGRS